MKEETTTVRNFLRNYKKIISKNMTIIIANNGTPETVCIPYKEWQKSARKKITRQDIEKFSFKGGKDLSKKIDEIVYTYPNTLKK